MMPILFYDGMIEKKFPSIGERLRIPNEYTVDWFDAKSIQSTFKPINKMGIRQIPIALSMDCCSETDRVAVVKWW